MLFAITRIFLLLFVPIGVWVIYSLYDESLYDLPKIDKVELLKLTYLEKTSTTKNRSIVSVSQMVLNETNKTVDEFRQENNLSSTSDLNASNLALDLNNEKIFILGDSMGEGIAYGMQSIKKSYHLDVQSIAKCSTTTLYWMKNHELEAKIQTYKPKIVLVILGTNEWNGVNNGTKLRIMQLHDRLEKLDVSSIWITPPVPNSDQFYEMVRDVYGDNAYDFRNIDLPRGPDNIHPTIKGYIVWSKAILLNLRNNGVL
jgi:hypothetical protein